MKKTRDTGHLLTEKVNQNTLKIDTLEIPEIVDLISREDHVIPSIVSNQVDNISKASELIVNSFNNKGRLFFVGAGTSGRLGVVEAAECPPTFGTDPELVQAIIAGGNEAFFRSIEGAEDSETRSQDELKNRELTKNDVVVGIAASSTTPFVKGALDYARTIGASTVLVTCNPLKEEIAGVTITLPVGPEVIVGSTRMKAGTATKMVLNMLTTAAMISLGKTYGNLMVDVNPKSSKLRDRAVRIVMQICDVKKDEALKLLEQTEWNVKASIVMNHKKLPLDESLKLLDSNQGFLKKIIG